MIRIIIADDHTMFREGLRKVLEQDSSFAIVGEAKDGNLSYPTRSEAEAGHPPARSQMPRQTGLESLPETTRLLPRTRIIFLTASMDTNEAIEALRVGRAIQEYDSWAMTKPLVPFATHRRRGNPNWGKFIQPIPAIATQFELQVKQLGLTKQTYTTSARLRACV